MGVFLLDISGPAPKRGDLLHSNVGDRRERTWFVICSREIKRRSVTVPRYRLWIERWWEVDPELRQRLSASANRNGGQNVIKAFRYKPQKRKAGLSLWA